MINFRIWLEQRGALEDFFVRVKRRVLATMVVQPTRVTFTFPLNYREMWVTAPAAPTIEKPAAEEPMERMPMGLAAGQYPEPTVEQRGFQQKKGLGAEKALRSLADPEWMDWGKYRKVMGKGLGKISSIIGFLFEIDVFLYFVKSKGLNTPSFVTQFETEKKEYIEQMSLKVPDDESKQMILFSIKTHAQDLAEKMLQKTASVLNCNVDNVMFTGGPTLAEKQRRDPADLALVCSEEEKRLGWSLKLTGETRVFVANLSPKSTYKLLGGGREKSFETAMKAGMDRWKKYGRQGYDFFLEEIMPYFNQAAEKKFENPASAPRIFANMLTKLLTGDKETRLAIRHYATGAKGGGADWSGAIKRDFYTNGRLKAKPNAVIIVEPSKTQLKITYKLKGGSQHGTKIFFSPKGEDITIKVTNLTSDR